VSGNLKFDVSPPVKSHIVAELADARRRESIHPVIVAGSTLEGEESLLLVLAPRHPERFAAVAALLASSTLGFTRRSEWNGEQAIAGRVLLLDSMGELAALYELADLAFIGGSL